MLEHFRCKTCGNIGYVDKNEDFQCMNCGDDVVVSRERLQSTADVIESAIKGLNISSITHDCVRPAEMRAQAVEALELALTSLQETLVR